MNAIDALVFDLDGTLVETAGDLAASMNYALVQLGRPAIDPQSVRAMVGHGARALIERGLTATGGMDATLLEAGIAHFMDYYARNIAVHSKPFDGVEAALDAFAAQGLILAICTNKPESLAKSLVRHLGWEGRFAVVQGADTNPWRKPDPRHLFSTLEACGAKNPIFIGDSKTDADTAIAAGVPLVLVTFGYSTDPVETLGADRLISHYDALLEAVASIQQGFNQTAAEPRP